MEYTTFENHPTLKTIEKIVYNCTQEDSYYFEHKLHDYLWEKYVKANKKFLEAWNNLSTNETLPFFDDVEYVHGLCNLLNSICKEYVFTSIITEEKDTCKVSITICFTEPIIEIHSQKLD